MHKLTQAFIMFKILLWFHMNNLRKKRMVLYRTEGNTAAATNVRNTFYICIFNLFGLFSSGFFYLYLSYLFMFNCGCMV